MSRSRRACQFAYLTNCEVICYGECDIIFLYIIKKFNVNYLKCEVLLLELEGSVKKAILLAK